MIREVSVGLRFEAFGERKLIEEWVADPRCNVTRSQLRQRLSDGWDFERALSTPPRPMHNRKPLIEAFGEQKTLAEWVADPRCRYTLTGVITRLKAGLSPAEAISGDRRKSRRMEYWHNVHSAYGEKKTLEEWARDPRFEVVVTTFRRRVAAGIPPPRSPCGRQTTSMILPQCLVEPAFAPTIAFTVQERVTNDCDAWQRQNNVTTRCPMIGRSIDLVRMFALIAPACCLPCSAQPLPSDSLLSSEASALNQLKKTKYVVDFRSASKKATAFPHGRTANPSAILRGSFLRNLIKGHYVPVPDGGFSIIFARIESDAPDLWELQAPGTLNFQGCLFPAMPAPPGQQASCLILSKSHWNRDLLFNKCRFEADVGLSQSSVNKLLSIRDCFFSGDLDLSSSAVGTYVLLEGNEIKGKIKADNVRVQYNVNIASTPLQYATVVDGVVSFENLRVGGSLRCTELRTPELVLRGATIDGNVELMGDGIKNLSAQDVSVKRTLWLGQDDALESIDLSVSTIDRLRLASLDILAKTNLRELVLNRISVDDPGATTVDHAKAPNWDAIKGQNLPIEFLKQLEETMSRAGEQSVADEIYIFRRRSLAERSDRSANTVDWVLFAMTGYGRQPARLLICFFPIFCMTLWWVGACGKPLRLPQRFGNYNWRYWPLLIWAAVDHLLPLAQLNSETAWQLDPPTLGFRNIGAVLSLCGLVLSITAVGLIATFFLGR